VIIDMGGGESYNTHADEIRASGDVQTALMGHYVTVVAVINVEHPEGDGSRLFDEPMEDPL
jgi:hypothetical protein